MDNLPGTTVEVNKNTSARGFLDTAFTLNGLVLSQVVQLTGLSAHTIQNWVKRKFVTPPVNKKYGCAQFCSIAIINMLKDLFNIERITLLLKYACGKGRDIDETDVYLAFCDTVNALPCDTIIDRSELSAAAARMAGKVSADTAAKDRLEAAVVVMALAYLSARVRMEADGMLKGIEEIYI